MGKRIVSSLPPVLLAVLAAVVFPQTAAAKAKGPGLSEDRITALIELKHPRGLNQLVRAVSDPDSPRYRQYSSVAALIARYGAKPKTRKKVLRWLDARGLEGAVTRSGTYVTATLPRPRAERLLPAVGDARAAATGSRERRIPAALRGAVTGIELVSAAPVISRHTAAPASTPAASASATKRPYTSIMLGSGTPKGCAASRTGGAEPGITPVAPNQYTSAYGHGAMHAKGFKGEGQTVAVIETGGFRRADIVTWARCFGLKPPPTKAVPVAPVKKPLPGELETTLDLQMLTAGAPGLDRILVYEGGGAIEDVLLTAGTALGNSRNKPDVISASLGFCEPDVSTSLVVRDALDDIFAVAAGAGISVMVSAGDQGSSGCRIEKEGLPASALPITAVSLPASSAYATAVGGTNVEFTKQNRIKKELVWNDAVLTPWGGGGGTSLLYPRTPWWQQGVGFGIGRKVPDVAGLADLIPGYSFYCGAPECNPEEGEVFGWSAVGGTSAAAPLTAAGVALANQYAAKRGQPNLGFLNPLLYKLGAKAGPRGVAFYDVTEGNNDIGRALPKEAGGGAPIGCCSARKGYDNASGWGSVAIPGLAELAARAAR